MIPLLCAVILAAPDTGAAWRAGVTYGFEAFTRERSTWHAGTMQVGRRLAHGTLVGEVLATRRFDLTDAGAAVDAYRDLWRRAYGNLRVQVAPGAAVLPRVDVAAELFQALPSGVELSAGYRRMRFAGSHADLLSVGLARYVGDWYVRARVTAVPLLGAWHASGTLAVRRSFGATDEFIDLRAGLGKEVIAVAPGPSGPVVDARRNRVAAVLYQRYLGPVFGVVAGATYTGTDGFPARRGLTIGVTSRW